MRMTAIGEAMTAKGINPRNVELQIAIAKFQNYGGEYGVALAMLNAAYGKGRGAAVQAPDQGQRQSSHLPASTDRAGLSIIAEKAKGGTPARLAPKPVSPAFVAAAKSGAKAIALTVLDSFKVRDGRPIGDITFGELERLRGESAQEASLLRQIQRHTANASPDAKVREIIKAADLERMIQRAAEVADAS